VSLFVLRLEMKTETKLRSKLGEAQKDLLLNYCNFNLVVGRKILLDIMSD
jgi:hypothetical protein